MSKTGKTIINVGKALLLPAALYLFLLILIPDRIGNLNSLLIMLSMSVIPAMIAYGMSFGWISGLIDFSIGSRVILASLVATVTGNLFGVAGLFLGAIATSLVLSAIAGGVFRLLRIPSLVVSLGLLMVFEIAGDRFGYLINAVWPQMSTGYYIKLDQSLTFLGTTPWNLVLLIVTAVAYSLIYYRTRFATQARAVGSDELIARNVGMKPMRVKFATYTVGALFLGVAAAVTTAYSGSASAQINMSTMSAAFRPMMAIVIALSMQKLIPFPAGIFLGTFSLNIIFTGIIALGWSDDLQNVLLGLFLILVVASPNVLDSLRTAKRRRVARRQFAQSGRT